jgi:hypothetical protein
LLALEPPVEVFASGTREQRQRFAPARQVKPGEDACLERRVDSGLESSAGVRRHLQRQRAEHVGDLLERRVVRGERGGIGGAEACDLGLAGGQGPAELQVVSDLLRQRQEVRQGPRHDAEPALGQLHVPDHLGLQQADGVACY